jgi:hypothetical protein
MQTWQMQEAKARLDESLVFERDPSMTRELEL